MSARRIHEVFGVLVGVALLACAAPARAGLAGAWKLDGDAKDGAGQRAGVVLGRGAFVDSIVGGPGGKALWCEGVNTAVRVDGAGWLGREGQSVSLWVNVLEAKDGGIAGGDGWSIELAKNGALRFVTTGAAPATRPLESPADRVGVGQWYHVAVAWQKGGASVMYVNGEACAEGKAPNAPGGEVGPLWIGRATEKGPGFVGLIDDVRIYSAKLPDGEAATLTDAGLPWLRQKPEAKKPFEGGRFEMNDNDVVAFVGGEDLYASQQGGYLETALTLAARGKRVHFRNMAWEGDTVFEQWRILNFGSWAKQFERVGASVIVVQFGQTESLKGTDGLAEFTAAYAKLLDDFSKRTRRIVVLSPTPFEDQWPNLPPADGRNDVLAEYADAARLLAEARGLIFVDLFRPLGGDKRVRAAAHLRMKLTLTRDGMHLSDYGQWAAAREAARRLGVAHAPAVTEDASPRFLESQDEELRQAIVAKNELWLRAWRPPNWAFLNGDRITQPSSKDHADQRVRWLPAEVQKYPVLVDEAERKIWGMAKERK